MPLVAANCTNCGGVLEVDSGLEAAICKYCETPFIVEKAINNYNIANARINAQTVIVNAMNSDFVVEGGVLVKYTGNDKKVIIPETVKVIADESFLDNLNIESVVITKSVVKIMTPYEAHHDLTIFDSYYKAKYKRGAFEGCTSLKEVYIADSVKSLSTGIFARCPNLTVLTLEGDVSLNGKTIKYNYDAQRWNSLGADYNIPRDLTIPKDIDRLSPMQMVAVYDCIFWDYHNTSKDAGKDRYINGINMTEKRNKASAIIQEENEKRMAQARAWKKQGLCVYCGGKVNIWTKNCRSCSKYNGK